MRRFILISAVMLAAACGGDGGGGRDTAAPPDLASGFASLPAEAQREGDPAAGYRALVNNGYVTCGVPESAYRAVFGPASARDRIPGREGRNADLPYWQTALTTASGVEVVSANCLSCHAGRLNGELIVGLGAADQDFTYDTGEPARAAGALVTDPAERAEWERWAGRVQAIAPYIKTATVGVNPADNLAAVLFAHRDPATLAWSDEPILELPPRIVVPVDVPPWWRMKKKHAMFYTAAGRGDHARIMMTASTLCTDSVDEASAIDAYFPDVRAYIYSLEPPRWPYAVDDERAARGKVVFERTCAVCHGTYGEGGRYPNLVIPVAAVGTDDTLALGASQFVDRFIDWYNGSFYGRISRLQPEDGYVAPPLDGIWATAPFLHNGSVPTLAALLDSRQRPQFWTRSFDSRDYDPDAVGWRFETVDHGQDDEPSPSARRLIYDTTRLGYGNGGHPFGDALTDEERAAVIEYLKTL